MMEYVLMRNAGFIDNSAFLFFSSGSLFKRTECAVTTARYLHYARRVTQETIDSVILAWTGMLRRDDAVPEVLQPPSASRCAGGD
jgi:hypothetical protein